MHRYPVLKYIVVTSGRLASRWWRSGWRPSTVTARWRRWRSRCRWRSTATWTPSSCPPPAPTPATAASWGAAVSGAASPPNWGSSCSDSPSRDGGRKFTFYIYVTWPDLPSSSSCVDICCCYNQNVSMYIVDIYIWSLLWSSCDHSQTCISSWNNICKQKVWQILDLWRHCVTVERCSMFLLATVAGQNRDQHMGHFHLT